MKRRLALLFLIQFIFTQFRAIAQEQLLEIKRVAEAQNGKIYINRNLGVYMWISSSPDMNSKKQRLFSDSTKRYTNPMYFDTEGYNTFHTPSAVDTVTKKMIYPERDIIFEVYSDGIAPKTEIRIVPGTTILINGQPCYNAKSRAVFKPQDIMSGVFKTYYSLDGANYNEFKDSILLGSEGKHTIKYYSSDNVGNRELANKLEYSIDNSAPETNYEIVGKTKDGKIGNKTAVKLSSKDNLAGVKAIYYQINDEPIKVYVNPIPAKLIGENLELFTFYSVDKLNNKESKKSIPAQ